jgi:hypothetical protein
MKRLDALAKIVRAAQSAIGLALQLDCQRQIGVLDVKLRLTKRVKRVLERAMRDDDWRDAGAGWQGKHGEIRLMGWSLMREQSRSRYYGDTGPTAGWRKRKTDAA